MCVVSLSRLTGRAPRLTLFAPSVPGYTSCIHVFFAGETCYGGLIASLPLPARRLHVPSRRRILTSAFGASPRSLRDQEYLLHRFHLSLLPLSTPDHGTI